MIMNEETLRSPFIGISPIHHSLTRNPAMFIFHELNDTFSVLDCTLRLLPVVTTNVLCTHCHTVRNAINRCVPSRNFFPRYSFLLAIPNHNTEDYGGRKK